MRAVGVLFRLQVGLENGFQDQQGCRLDHAIFDRWNAERTFAAFLTRFRDHHPSHRGRPIRLFSEFCRQFV